MKLRIGCEKAKRSLGAMVIIRYARLIADSRERHARRVRLHPRFRLRLHPRRLRYAHVCNCAVRSQGRSQGHRGRRGCWNRMPASLAASASARGRVRTRRDLVRLRALDFSLPTFPQMPCNDSVNNFYDKAIRHRRYITERRACARDSPDEQ